MNTMPRWKSYDARFAVDPPPCRYQNTTCIFLPFTFDNAAQLFTLG